MEAIKLDFLTSNSMLLTQKGLDFLWQKQLVTLNNIANAETPGYKAGYVTFEEEIRNRLSSQNNNSISSIKNEIMDSKINYHTTENESSRLDGNNVQTDLESVELARATLQYQYMVKSFNDDYSRLRSAIKGQ